jgi:hypothetical protein
MYGGAPVDRANHMGLADPDGPWAGLPIAHDQDEYDAAIRVLHKRGRRLVPGFMLKLVVSADRS